MNQRIKRKFMSCQYKQDRLNMCKMIEKYDFLRWHLFDSYSIADIMNHNNISYED